ncbi:MAG: hypothetical protein P4M04_09485 [Acidobacteriota bacterium]|nr:hypothetical protein [Acidobacteriota bacterium]
MTIQNNGFEVKVRLQPTVRQINRAPKQIPPAAEPGVKRGRLPRITQVLALALQFQEMVDRGEIRRHSDLARLGCVSRERISQMMVLTWLAPDIQEAILRLPQMPGGRLPVSEGALRGIARLPLWEDQREKWESVPFHGQDELP